MGKPLLTDIEDRTLAMADEEYVHFKLARRILRIFYERDVSSREISAILGRLSSDGLIRWRIRQNGRTYFRTRAPEHAQRNCSAAFMATALGKAYLAAPRNVA